MNPVEDIHELIDRYLNGEMGNDERTAFETRLQMDEDLSITLRAQKVAHKIVIGKELVALKAQMSRDMQGGNPGAKVKGNPIKYYIGAGLIVAVGIILYLMMKDRPAKQSQQAPVHKKIEDTVTVIPEMQVDSIVPLSPDNNIEPTPDKKKKAEVKTTCTDSIISFSCQARAACTSKGDGAIEIDVNTIKSGTPPFMFSVEENGVYQQGSMITDLKAGKYPLFVKDRQGCTRKLNVRVEVPEIHCDHSGR